MPQNYKDLYWNFIDKVLFIIYYVSVSKSTKNHKKILKEVDLTMKLKTILLSAIFLLLFASTSVYAETYENLYYQIYDEGLTITGVARTDITEIEIPRTINGMPVVAIGTSAFSNADQLTSLTIPDTVTSIGVNAFNRSGNLRNIYISSLENWCSMINSYEQAPFHYASSVADNNSGNLYLNGKLIEELIIPEGVTQINQYAFWGCTSIKKVVLPEGFTHINGNAFAFCKSITDIVIPKSLSYVGIQSFYFCDIKNVYISDMTSWVKKTMNSSFGTGYDLFLNGELVEDVVIPRDVGYSIPDYAFSGCKSIKTVTAYDCYFTSIEVAAFKNCINLTSITGLSEVLSLEENAFKNCRSLVAIDLPDSCHGLGAGAFSDCISLKEFSFPKENSYYFQFSENLFDGCTSLEKATLPPGMRKIAPYMFRGCTNLKSITIPDSVTSIGAWAFSGCTSLSEVNLSSKLTTIDSSAFEDCTSLIDLELPFGLVEIGGSAFSGCANLKSVKIPYSVTTIKSYAFQSCSSLETIAIPDDVSDIADYLFRGCTDMKTIYAPHTLKGSANLSPYEDLVIYYNGDNDEYVSVKYEGLHNDWEVVKKGNDVALPTSDTVNLEFATDGSQWEGKNVNSPAVITVTGKCVVTYIGDYEGEELVEYGKKAKLLPDTIDYYYTYYVDEGVWKGTTITVHTTVTVKKNFILTYEITAENKARVIGCDTKVAEVIIPNTFEGYPVTEIGQNAFADCTSLKKLTIPDSIEVVGADAFPNAVGAVSITDLAKWCNIDFENLFSAPRGANLYLNGTLVESITIPQGMTQVKPYTFADCTSIKEVIIPDTVTSVGDMAFYRCTSLTNLQLPDTLQSIGNSAFFYCKGIENLTIPASLTQIRDGAFGWCTIKNTYITDLIKWCNIDFAAISSVPIGDNLYLNGTLVETLVIPCDVTKIPAGLFGEVSSIKEVVISDGVTFIDNKAFYRCPNLEKVTIAGSVKEIGNHAFYGNNKLTSITLAEGVTTLGIQAISYCTTLPEIILPGSVTTISDYAFYGNDSITSITLPKSVTEVGIDIFKSCYDLERINVHYSLIDNQNLQKYSSKIKYYCIITSTGYFSGSELIEYNTKAMLPDPPLGYVYKFYTTDGTEWTGENITTDITVNVVIAPFTYSAELNQEYARLVGNTLDLILHCM